MHIVNGPNGKIIASENYNLVFDSKTGFLARWGKTKSDDPTMCPIGPEIADIEISTICHGVGPTMETRRPCSVCYKQNTGCGENMSFETFQKVFDKLPPSLTQIAFGIGDIDGNPDLWRIMDYCRANYVIPNITVNGMGVTDEIAQKLAQTCGAVAVSHYGDELCFNTIKKLTDAGLSQVNIHQILAHQTYEDCFRLIDSVASDPRLAKMKAIVFLLLKPKGDRNRLTGLRDMAEYAKMFDYAMEKGVAIGMDSCSAPMVLKVAPASVIPSVEPCESGLFSIYMNVRGEIFPCSFTENRPGWETGIDMKVVEDFTRDVWYNPRIVQWRENLLNSSSGCKKCSVQRFCRSCPAYDITLCKET